jgi:hypothetical protein
MGPVTAADAPLINELHDRRLLRLAKTVQDAIDRGDGNGLTVEQMRDVLLAFPALVNQLHEGAPLMLAAARELADLRAEVQRLREERDSAIDRGLGYRHERGVAEYTIDNMQRERAALLARAEAAEARVAELERERDEAFSELEAIAHAADGPLTEALAGPGPGEGEA